MNYNFLTELNFTEVYKKYKDEHPAIREAKCLEAQYPDYFAEIREEDLFAGRIKHGMVGFSPDEWGSTAFGYYILKDKIEDALIKKRVPEDQIDQVKEMIKFWETENTSAKLRARYNIEMAKYLPSDDWMNDSGIAFPLYRLTGANVDFGKLMLLGIPGLRKEIESKMTDHIADDNKKLYEAMIIALNVLERVIQHYIDVCKTSILEVSTKRKNELENIISTLQMIKTSKPRTFREAAQLFWLYSLIADVRNYGRMDVYFGDFLARDLKDKVLTETQALELMQSLWRLMADRNTVVHNRVIIGGKGRSNEKNADIFAMYAMEATRTVLEAEPQLSLRIYDGMDDKIYEKALDVIGEGRTYPIIYNDEVNINSVVKAFNFTELESEQYVPYGCGEYILEHKSFGTPSGVINLLKALEITLHNGVDPITEKPMGLALGKFEDFKDFDELWNAYKKQVEHYIKIMAEHEALEYKIAGETAPYLFLSMLYDDCIEIGKGIFSGGIKYLGGTLETYGNSNTADSLLAIKKLVFDEKVISKEDLLNALDANFEGYDNLRNILKNAPKYGNDDNDADEMLTRVHNHVCNYVRDQKDRVGLHSYLVVIINNSANTLMGRSTSASADGRPAYISMNNGNAPTSGNDTNGVTALLNSLVKPNTDIHAGAVQNMKFSREMFTVKRTQLKALLKTYFDNGGPQAMITVINKDDLKKAIENPEEYQHIFVRVGGFSARFVELSKDVQLDILNRTLY